MSHSWVLGFHHRGQKGILPLEIASDLQQDKLYVFLPCLPLTHQVLHIVANRITSPTGQPLYIMEQVTSSVEKSKKKHLKTTKVK